MVQKQLQIHLHIEHLTRRCWKYCYSSIQIIPDNDCPTIANPLPDLNVQEDAEDSVFTVSSVFDDVDRVGGIPDNLSYSVTHTGAGIATVNLNIATKSQ